VSQSSEFCHHNPFVLLLNECLFLLLFISLSTQSGNFWIYNHTLNFLLLATLAVMVTFLSGYKRKDEGNESVSNKDNEASSNTETYVIHPNAQNSIQNICFLGSQISILMEKTGHNV
jgi:hypothetical protein